MKNNDKNEKPLNATKKLKENECSRSSSSKNQMTMNKNGIIDIFPSINSHFCTVHLYKFLIFLYFVLQSSKIYIGIKHKPK